MNSILHDTLVFARQIPAHIDAVFAAYATPKARVLWGVPSETATLIYDVADFREGGLDRFRCGSKADPNIHGETRYLEIIPSSRVVSSETISVAGKRLCASLTTLELETNGQNTMLKNTTQLASFIGEHMRKGHLQGTNASLDNLVKYFEVQARRDR
jgi:uncharacterized protein YndB with AHSA1/START domain